MSEEKSVQFGVAKTVDEKIHLITRGLQEVMGDDKAIASMREILEKRDLKIYWGTATTGAPHIAYFVPMTKIADFLRAGCEVTILFADLHAYLDNQKAPWDLLKHRTDYYEHVIKGMLESIGVPLDKLKFVRGSDFQLQRDYTLDVYRLTAMTTERNSKKAGAEVVKQVESPLLSGMIYPLLQALDEEYLKVDAQFGGVDQRKIFTYAETYLPKIGYKKRIHLMNPMVPSLSGGKGNKMSSSDANSKIDLLDTPQLVTTKIRAAFAEPGVVEDNGLLAFVNRVLFPLATDGKWIVERLEKHGGNLVFNNYCEVVEAYKSKSLYPLDLKNAVTASINRLLSPIRAKFETTEMQELLSRAYPVGGAEHGPVPVDDDDEGNPESKSNPASTTTSTPATTTPANPSPAPSAEAATGKGKGGKGKGGAAEAKTHTEDVYKLDLRVAVMKNVRNHPDADSLYIMDADIGSDAPVQVVTNLRGNGVTIDALEGKKIVMLCNMKPTSFRGAKSLAMILGGGVAGGAHGQVTPINEDNAKAGERVYLEGQSPVVGDIPRANEKVIDAVFGQLGTNDDGQLTWSSTKLTVASGRVAIKGVANAVFKTK